MAEKSYLSSKGTFMAKFARIDNSLPQRSDLVRLFHTLEREDFTLEDMEKIARTVQNAGRQALPPLLRRLRKVTNGPVIARYLYLLDIFDDESWLNELVRITLMRTDLDIAAKTVLLAGLERSGIDIEELPFSRLLAEVGGSSPTGLAALLARGEAGFISFMEDFDCFSSEYQLVLVRLLATKNGPGAEALLEILLGYSDREVVKEAIISLGRIRRESAASVLLRYVHHGDGSFRSLAERSLRRLSFLAVFPDPAAGRESEVFFHRAAVSSIGGSGFRSLWFSRWNSGGGLDVLLLQTHETCGITDAAGYGNLTLKAHDELFREAVVEECLAEVSSDYAHAIMSDAERTLHLGLLVEMIEDYLGVLITFQVNDNSHPVTVRLVPEVGNPLQLLLPHQLGNLDHQIRLVHLIRNLGHNDRLPLGLFLGFNKCPGPHLYDAAAGLVTRDNTLATINETTGGKIRTRNNLDQLFEGELRIADKGDDPVDYLREIVGRDIGGHADRYSGGTVHQQVRKLGREHQRLMEGTVVVGSRFHRLFIQIFQKFMGKPGHADLGVTHRRRRITVHGAEISLAIHQRIAERKTLGHADDGVVGSRITVWVILTDHVTDNTGRLLVRLVPVVAHVIHGIQAAPVHRLQTVPHVGEGSADDDAHGIVHV